jgi:hypothetical protein
MFGWLAGKLSYYLVKKSDFDRLRDRVVFLEKTLSHAEAISARQSELLAALAGVQNDLVMAVGDNFLYKAEKEATYTQQFILAPPDDDDLIN